MATTNFKTLRLRTGMSQPAFAAKLGVTEMTISNWENGKTRPTSRVVLLAVSLVLGVPIEEITFAADLPPLPTFGLPSEVLRDQIDRRTEFGLRYLHYQKVWIRSGGVWAEKWRRVVENFRRDHPALAARYEHDSLGVFQDWWESEIGPEPAQAITTLRRRHADRVENSVAYAPELAGMALSP